MKIVLTLLLGLALSAVVPMIVWGDLAPPFITKVYFEKDGMPHRSPVNFTFRCFYPGQGPALQEDIKKPGDYKPEEAFSISTECPDEECKIDRPFFLSYWAIDYCNLVGETEGRRFRIEKIYLKECKLIKATNMFECTVKVSIPK